MEKLRIPPREFRTNDLRIAPPRAAHGSDAAAGGSDDGSSSNNDVGPADDLPAAMARRLAAVDSELQEYWDRRVGVGRALAFMARMEAQVQQACVVDGQRARAVFDQERLDTERTARREAEATAAELRVEALTFKSTIRALRQRVRPLERQHDLERQALAAGFADAGFAQKQAEDAQADRLHAVWSRIDALATRVASVQAMRAKAAAAAAAAEVAERAKVLDADEYVAAGPLTQKGTRSYLLLNDSLKTVEDHVAKRNAELHAAHRDHEMHLAAVQRKARDLRMENAALWDRVAELEIAAADDKATS